MLVRFPPIVERIIIDYSWHFEKQRIDAKFAKGAHVIKLGIGSVLWVKRDRIVYAIDADTGEMLSDRYDCDSCSPFLCDKQGRLYYIYMNQLMRVDSRMGVSPIYRWPYLKESWENYMRFNSSEKKLLVVTSEFKHVIDIEKAVNAVRAGRVYHTERVKNVKQYVAPPLEVGRPDSDDLSISASLTASGGYVDRQTHSRAIITTFESARRLGELGLPSYPFIVMSIKSG